MVRAVTEDMPTGGLGYPVSRTGDLTVRGSEAMMRVVIQQPQSIRRDMLVLTLLVLFGVLTVAVLLIPGVIG
jgi:hypothetical protein